jgi:aminoglycoside 6'-N-acetyltransferase
MSNNIKWIFYGCQLDFWLSRKKYGIFTNVMNINFKPMTLQHIPLWDQWITIPHVKEVWFIEGYEPPDYIYQKIKGNGYDHSFIIYNDDQPIGYIVYCDLYAYRTICPQPKGVFTHENPGTFCIDLFIADKDYLNKGYGTEIVKRFSAKIMDELGAKKILIDPAITNKRAIRCYEKAGYRIIKYTNDGITDCCIMEKLN